jgi:hypothetical protein
MVFWSAAAVTSRNVRHEATVAQEQGKLIPVMLEPLRAEQFPMGLYTTQGANLAGWNGDRTHAEWRKLRREVEVRLTPPWAQQLLHDLEAELVAEQARREAVEARDRSLKDQIARMAQAEQQLRRERDDANDEIAALKARIDALQQERDGRMSSGRVRETAAQRIALGRRPETSSQTGAGTAKPSSAAPPRMKRGDRQDIGSALIFCGSAIAAQFGLGILLAILSNKNDPEAFPIGTGGVLLATIVSAIIARQFIIGQGATLHPIALSLYWFGCVAPLSVWTGMSFAVNRAPAAGAVFGVLILLGSAIVVLGYYGRLDRQRPPA